MNKRVRTMGTDIIIPCLLTLLTLGFLGSNSGASDPGNRQDPVNRLPRLPNAMVVGTVYCDTCFHQELSKTSHFISGAVVAVECGENPTAEPGFRKEARTNRHGVFRVRLPPQLGKHTKSMQACSVKLVSSSEPFCAVAASATSSSLRPKSRTNRGVHVYSAGFFTFRPLQQPELCYQKPSPAKSPQLGSTKTFAPYPNLPVLGNHPLPQLPQLPQLPPFPSLPSLPSLGPPAQPKPEASSAPAMDQKQDQPAFSLPSPPTLGAGVTLPSNPFQPPPLLPTNPLQPPSSVLPSLPFQPPPPSFFSIPFPRPNLPSPPPAAGFQFPQFPFPPSPFFPGIPPAFPSKEAAP